MATRKSVAKVQETTEVAAFKTPDVPESLGVFTVDAATRKGGLGDPHKSLAYVIDEGMYSREVGGRAMWDAALHAYNATRFEIGKAKNKAADGSTVPDKGKTWAEQKDYAESMGVTSGYVTSLKRLGKVAAEFGVTLGSREWTWLATNAAKPIARPLWEFEKAETFTTALTNLIEHGNVAGEQPAIESGESEETETDTSESSPRGETDVTESESERDGRPPRATLGDAAVTIGTLESILNGLSDESLTRAVGEVHEMLDRVAERREALGDPTVSGEVVSGETV